MRGVRTHFGATRALAGVDFDVRLRHADVDVLLLDEPTRGIDVGSKAQMYGRLDRLACGDPESGRPGKAVLLVSSYLPELLGICDRHRRHASRASQRCSSSGCLERTSVDIT
jgi:ABC-type uncharacterized transport system ATPase subunit